MVKILMLTGDAGEAQEIYYAKFRLEEEGWLVHIAMPEKRVFHSVVHDFEPGFDTYTEKPGYRVQADLSLDDVAVEQYQGLVLPGGRAGISSEPAPRIGNRRPFPGGSQANCRQLPRPLATLGRGQFAWADNDLLPRTRARCAKRRCQFRQPGGSR